MSSCPNVEMPCPVSSRRSALMLDWDVFVGVP